MAQFFVSSTFKDQFFLIFREHLSYIGKYFLIGLLFHPNDGLLEQFSSKTENTCIICYGHREYAKDTEIQL
jgi:hypothetical protein